MKNMFYKTQYSCGIKLNKIGDSHFGITKLFKFFRFILRYNNTIYFQFLFLELCIESKKESKNGDNKIDIDSTTWFKSGV
jgi:hypothetical protein